MQAQHRIRQSVENVPEIEATRDPQHDIFGALEIGARIAYVLGGRSLRRLRPGERAPGVVTGGIFLLTVSHTACQQRALQKQLLRSSRATSVGEMATTLAHEINQPLATIVNCLAAARALLGQRGLNTHRVRQALDLAYEQAGQAAAVVARLREFVSTHEPRREPQSLSALIERVVRLQQLDAQKHRVRITVKLAADLPQVLVDRVMVEQVFTNVVRNGIEAMRLTRVAERELTIAARLHMGGRIEVRVADRGPDISISDEAQLFTPFFTTKPNGMGVGLAICRSIVECHRGHLYFERHTGGGSVFAFTLPLVPTS